MPSREADSPAQRGRRLATRYLPASAAASRVSRKGLAKVVVAVVAVTTVVSVPVVTNDQYVLDVLCECGLFVLLACGLNIVVSLAGLLDLGYIAFWAVGAYVSALLSSNQFNLFLPFPAIVIAALLATSFFAIVIGLPTLRLRGDYLAIVTLGFGEIVRIALINGGAITGGPSGIQGIARPSLLGFQFTYDLTPYYYLISILCGIALVLGYLIRQSRLGLIWQALRDDELAARTVGLRPLKYYLMAFGIGAAFAGVSGMVFASLQIAISPDSFIVNQSFLVLAIVVLGGMTGKFWPVALSALIVVGLPEALRGLQDYRLVVFGPILVAVIILRERWAQVRALLFASFAGVWGRWARRPIGLAEMEDGSHS